MRQRAVRLPVLGGAARVGDLRGQLVNLSIGGALLRLDAPAPINGEFIIVLLKGSDVLRIPARIVRTTPDMQESPHDAVGWFVAVEFTALPIEARATMPRFVARTPTAMTKRETRVLPAR